MKKLIYFSTLFLATMLSCVYSAQAQYVAPSGNTSVTVEDPNGRPITYNYPDDFPNTSYNCNQTGSEGNKFSYTDIGCTKSFGQFKDKDGNAPIVTVQMRIGPSGVGTFPLKPSDSDHPYGTLEIDLNSPAKPLNDFLPGANGVITISDYPPVGGYIMGSFKATLKDVAGNAYLVHGKFRIKRQSNTQ